MSGLTAIPFEAEDAAGNVTRGEIALTPTSNGPPGIQKGEPGLPVLPRWAFLNPSATVSDFPMLRAGPIRTAQGSGRTPPTIKLTDVTALQIVYYDAIYLEGKVSGTSAITAFSINGEPFCIARVGSCSSALWLISSRATIASSWRQSMRWGTRPSRRSS